MSRGRSRTPGPGQSRLGPLGLLPAARPNGEGLRFIDDKSRLPRSSPALWSRVPTQGELQGRVIAVRTGGAALTVPVARPSSLRWFAIANLAALLALHRARVGAAISRRHVAPVLALC